MPFTTSSKPASLHAVCPDLLLPSPAAFRVKNRAPQGLHFVFGALLAAGVVVAFVLALHSA